MFPWGRSFKIDTTKCRPTGVELLDDCKRFLVSMMILTFVVMQACVCVCGCVCVCVCDTQLVNTISQEGKLGQISYLVLMCTTLSTRSL